MTSPATDVYVDGLAVLYRLYDVGYEIRLDRALELLRPNAAVRVRPARGDAQALQIANPPLSAVLGTETVDVHGVSYEMRISVRLFDFGVCSLRITIPAPPAMPWNDFVTFGTAVDVDIDFTPVFLRYMHALTEQLAPAIERPQLAPVTEDFVVFRLTRLADAHGTALAPSVLQDGDIASLLLNERRPLSVAAQRELLPHRYRFSYYEDDLAFLTWDNALVIDPAVQDEDIQYILEFANAQLLELRVYDALLDAELPAMYDRIAAARARWLPSMGRNLRRVLAALQTRVADITEPVERVENALKVTDDVYLARVYAAALDLFREQTWRRGIDRKLAIIRGTYEMLNGEAQAARSEMLEMIIVVLIVAELVLALIEHR
jgi:hypothetical protein